MQREGYWYKKGSIIDITNSSHIRCIYDTPEQFGLTTTEVQETHASHNETPPHKGKAREVLIKKGKECGWIRVRHYVGKKDYWSIQFYYYDKRKNAIRALVNLLVSENSMSRYNTIVLTDFKTDNKLQLKDAEKVREVEVM